MRHRVMTADEVAEQVLAAAVISRAGRVSRAGRGRAQLSADLVRVGAAAGLDAARLESIPVLSGRATSVVSPPPYAAAWLLVTGVPRVRATRRRGTQQLEGGPSLGAICSTSRYG